MFRDNSDPYLPNNAYGIPFTRANERERQRDSLLVTNWVSLDEREFACNASCFPARLNPSIELV